MLMIDSSLNSYLVIIQTLVNSHMYFSLFICMVSFTSVTLHGFFNLMVYCMELTLHGFQIVVLHGTYFCSWVRMVRVPLSWSV